MSVISKHNMNINHLSVAMIFDVETTGLLSKTKETCPHVLQCSYILYNIQTHEIMKTMDSYVKIPKEVLIPPESTAIHGITRAHCDSGREMSDILTEFYQDYHNASVLVAHNYKFDTTMLNIEFQRNWSRMKASCPFALNLFHPVYMKSVNIDHICTMESCKDMCKIPFPESSTGKRSNGYKWPTLLELYRHLFHTTPANLHDSMMDCIVCLRCVLKVSCDRDLEENDFVELVRKIKK